MGQIASPSRSFDGSAGVAPEWHRRPDGGLCPLSAFDPADVATPGAGGVYIVGFGDEPLKCLLVGHADDLAYEIACLKSEPSFRHYERRGGVYVTWIELPVLRRNAVERYVADRLRPVYDCRRPSTDPMPLALPAEFDGASGDLISLSGPR